MMVKNESSAAVSAYEEVEEFRTRLSEADDLRTESFRCYGDLLEFFSRPRGATAEPPPLSLVKGKALSNLYRTFVSASERDLTTLGREQWNPLAQRPVLAAFPKPRPVDLATEFEALRLMIEAYITVSHEISHVMTWEPFFTGHFNASDTDAFVEYSLLSEGFSFFYSDILVAANVRERFPDGEFVFRRSYQSQRNFHPYRAFKALGVSSPKEILKVYLDAFVSRKNNLEGSRSNFVSALGARVSQFYAEATRASVRQHLILSVTGIFSDFYERFCSKPGIPSLFPENFLKSAGTEGIRNFYEALFESGLDHIEALTDADIHMIRLRRTLQTRAYYAFHLLSVMENGWYVPADLNEEVASFCTAGLEDYVSRLESLLGALASRTGNISDIEDKIRGADRDYDTGVRAVLMKHGLWSGERQEIIPRKQIPGYSTSFDPEKPKSADQILKSCCLLGGLLLKKILKESEKAPAAGEPAGGSLKETEAVGRLMRVLLNVKKFPEDIDVRREFSEVLSLPSVLGVWSVPLSSFDPQGNRFEEILFSYE